MVASVGSSTGVITGGAGLCTSVGTGGGTMAGRSPVSGSGDNAGAVVAMSSALLAHQLPPLSKFGGGTGADGDKETVNEWLEQFELVAGVAGGMDQLVG